MISLLWLMFMSAQLLLVQGKECPEDAGLKAIVKKHTKQVLLKDLDGVWMVVQAPESEIKDMKATFSSFDVNEAKTELEVSVKDIFKNNIENMYFQSIKKKTGGAKNVLSWTGRYYDDSIIDKDVFIFYADKNAVGYYSCEPGKPMDKHWTVRIMVKAAKRSELLATTDNDTKKSYKAAVDKLGEMKTEEKKWTEAHPDKFGLFDPIVEMKFEDLEPVDYKEGEPVPGKIL